MSTISHSTNEPHRRHWRVWLQLVVAVGVMGVLAWRFGTGPFLHAVRSLNPWVIAAGCGLVFLTTLFSAYRWHVIAKALGVPLPLPRAIRAYYRSQLLNNTLPGGMLGDVDRGLQEHRDGQPLGRALRAVAWDRALGQVILMPLAAALLVLVPSRLRDALPRTIVILLVVGACLAAALVALSFIHTGRTRKRRDSDLVTRLPQPWAFMLRFGGRASRALASDWRNMRATPKSLGSILGSSLLAVASTAGLFLLAAYTVAPHTASPVLISGALVILVIGSIPLNVAGWGPREGAAASVFAIAGLGAAQGLSVSVLFGLLTLIGTLPGVIVLVTGHGKSGRGTDDTMSASDEQDAEQDSDTFDRETRTAGERAMAAPPISAA